MERTTTREKFRARRKARTETAYWRGAKWRPIDIHRMRIREQKPLVFNLIPMGVFRDNWLGDPPFGGFENYAANHGEPGILTNWDGGPLMADGTPADPEQFGVITIDAATETPNA